MLGVGALHAGKVGGGRAQGSSSAAHHHFGGRGQGVHREAAAPLWRKRGHAHALHKVATVLQGAQPRAGAGEEVTSAHRLARTVAPGRGIGNWAWGLCTGQARCGRGKEVVHHRETAAAPKKERRKRHGTSALFTKERPCSGSAAPGGDVAAGRARRPTHSLALARLSTFERKQRHKQEKPPPTKSWHVPKSWHRIRCCVTKRHRTWLAHFGGPTQFVDGGDTNY